MATSQSSEVLDITKCSICLEEFKKPKYLPCLHTFCEDCLHSYITTAFHNKATKRDIKPEFECPVCRGSVKVPDATVQYQEWAKQFPLNNLIVALIDQRKLKAKVKNCDPCRFNNCDVSADVWCLDCNEALCDMCIKLHKGLKISRDHTLKNVNEMIGTPVMATLHSCVYHKGKNIEAFCKDHDQPCCTSCVAIQHRKCDHVFTIEEAANGVLVSKDLSGLSQRLNDVSELNRRLLKEKRENVKELEKQKNQIQNETESLTQNVVSHLMSLQSKFMQEFLLVHDQKLSDLNSRIKELENREKVLQNCTNILQTCKTQMSETVVFLEMKKIVQREKEQSEVLQQTMRRHRRMKYDIKLGENIRNLTTNLTSIGTVDVVEKSTLSVENENVLALKLLKDCTPKKISSFCTKTKLGIESWICGCCFLKDGSLLLPMWDEKLLVRCNVNGLKKKQSNVLSGQIWDAAALDQNTVVVTRPLAFAIDFVNIQTMRVNKTISVNEQCYSVACSDDTLYVGCLSKILVLHKDNYNKINEMKSNGCIQGVTVINGKTRKVVYTNWNTHSCHFVRASDLQELHTFTHKDLRNPRGITSDRDGNVYIAGNFSHNVFQLSSEGFLIRILLTGLIHPSGIQFDGDSNRLFVSQSSPANVDIYEMIP